MKYSRYLFISLTILLFLIGIWLRIYKFEGFTTYLSDQGRDAIIVKQIVTFEHFPAIGAPSSVGQVYLGPFYYYLIAPFLPLFHFNPIGLSYASLCYSLLGMLLITYVLKKEYGASLALTTLFMMVFSITLISFARFSWNPNLLPYFGFFTLYFFHKWLEKKKMWQALAFGSLFGLAIQLHYLAIFLGIPILSMYLWSLYKSKNVVTYIVELIPAIGGFLVFLSPLIVFDIRHQGINIQQFIKLLTEGGLTSGQPYLRRLMGTITGLVNHGLQIQTSSVISLAIVSLLVGIGIWQAYTSKSRFARLHILNIVTYLIGFAYLGNLRFAHYYGPIYISLFFVISFIIVSQKNVIARNASFVLLLVGFLALNIPQYHFFFQTPNDQIKHAKTVAMELKKHIGNKPYNIATWPIDMGEDRYIYFLETANMPPAHRSALEITNQMFVLCSQEPCMVTDSPSWNISMFGPAHVVAQWNVEDIKIYKLEHNDSDSL